MAVLHVTGAEDRMMGLEPGSCVVGNNYDENLVSFCFTTLEDVYTNFVVSKPTLTLLLSCWAFHKTRAKSLRLGYRRYKEPISSGLLLKNRRS